MDLRVCDDLGKLLPQQLQEKALLSRGEDLLFPLRHRRRLAQLRDVRLRR